VDSLAQRGLRTRNRWTCQHHLRNLLRKVRPGDFPGLYNHLTEKEQIALFRALAQRDVEIGADCTIHAGVVLREGTRVGGRVVLHPGVVLGADGFGYTGDEEGRLFKVPQVGIVVIEDDVEIGAGTTVDRATLDETRIRRGARIDNLVQIAHNCDVGEGAVIAAQVGLAGSVRVGAGAALMGQVGVADHVEIGAGAFAAARSGIMRDVPPGARVFGQPAVPEKGWHRVTAALPRLPDALRRLRRLERQLEAGEAPGSKPPRPSTDEDA